MKYNRILLKLSGEAIGGKDGVGLDENVMAAYAQQIAAVVKQGVQVAIVIGGGPARLRTPLRRAAERHES